MIGEVLDVRVAAQKPEQLVDDRLEVQLLGGDHRKAIGQRVARLRTEHRVRSRARAVGLERTVVEDESKEFLILDHDASNSNASREAPAHPTTTAGILCVD